MGLYQDAVRYYEPLQQVADQINRSYLSELASCYVAMGQRAEAEECYRGLLDFDDEHSNDDDSEYEGERWKARTYLGQAEDQAILSEEEEGMSDIDLVAPERLATRTTRAQFVAKDHGDTKEDPKRSMLAPTRTARRARRRPVEQEFVEKEDLKHLFAHRQALSCPSDWGELHQKWLSVTKNLIKHFVNEKAFFPEQRHHEFMGYTREARHSAKRKTRDKVAVSQIEKGERSRLL